MNVYDKIRFMRRANNWSQAYVAEKLDMSLNGYADIERGQTDISLSRLEKIAKLFGCATAELVDAADRNIFYLTGTNNTGTQNNHSNCIIGTVQQESSECKSELERLRLIVANYERLLEMKDQEINYLKEINTLLQRDKMRKPDIGCAER